MLRRIKKVIIVLFVVLIVIGLFNIDRIIPIKDISCVSQFGPCNESITEALLSFEGGSLRNSKINVKSLLENHDRINDYGLRYIFPSKIEVNIDEIKPEVAVQLEGQTSFSLIDSKGRILGAVEETQLPLILTNDKLSEAEYEFAAQILLSLNDLYGIRTIRVNENHLQASVPAGYEVLFPVSGDVDVLLGSLRLILFQLNEKPQEFKINTIDLRYKNPVIR